MGLSGGPWQRYGQSKLANSVFAMALNEKLQSKSSNVKCVCAEPGYSVTNLQSTTEGIPGWMAPVMSFMPRSSAADGSLSACMACFSDDAQSGDFYAPEKIFNGPPVKVIEAGKLPAKSRDQPSVDPENHKLVWEACEKACGVVWKL